MADAVKYFVNMSRSIKNGEDALCAVKLAVVRYFKDNAYYFDIAGAVDQICANFTLNNIVSKWAGSSVDLYEEETYALTDGERESLYAMLDDKSVGLYQANSEVIGRIYEKTLNETEKRNAGIVYTPEDIVEYMTDIIREDIASGHKLIDPACGCGMFLSGFYDALMNHYCYENDTARIREAHIKILRENIYGFDVSKAACAVAKLTLALKYKECHIPANIAACDSLLALPGDIPLKSFDFVVTNPPYIGHKHIDASYMRLLKMFYADVYFDKADVSYCFFRLGCDLLKNSGRLIYVTSRYFAESLYASRLRKFLLENFSFVKIVDFYGVRPFKGVGIDPMVVFLRKGKSKGTRFTVVKPQPGTRYFDIRSEKKAAVFSMRQDVLSAEGFNFHNVRRHAVLEKIDRKCPLRLEDIAVTFQGVISGADRAFIVSGKDDVYKKCIRECGVKWIKSKDVGPDAVTYHGVYLLYTNGREPKKLKHTLKKLAPYRALLETRRECKNGVRKWYELQWPRKKELFENKKIVFPYKCDQNKFVVDAGGHYFSADVYAVALKKQFQTAVSYEKLALYLNSAVCAYYFQSYAKKLGAGLYEYYPNTVKKIALPPPEALESFETGQDIFDYFGLTKEELSD